MKKYGRRSFVSMRCDEKNENEPLFDPDDNLYNVPEQCDSLTFDAKNLTNVKKIKKVKKCEKIRNIEN